MGKKRHAAAQLRRMRGMTRFYHERFFADIRFTTVAVFTLFVVGWWQVEEAFLLIPVAALLGAIATAFDASYLIFARQYAARLEGYLDDGSGPLVAAKLEEVYLFPLDRRKIVTAAFGTDFTWFGFVTLAYTFVGVAAGGFGLALGLPVLNDHGSEWALPYLTSLGSALVMTLVVGVWWFVGGAGERRLKAVLDERFS
jgi:hypothetical protein